MSSVDLVGVGVEVVVAERGEAFEHRVDLGLVRDEGGERGVVGRGHRVVSRSGVGDHQARGRASIKRRVRRQSGAIR